jgi:gliding motility-associated-like protein
MKRLFIIAHCSLPTAYWLLIAYCLLPTAYCFSQTVLYNGGTTITNDVNSVIYVDGNITNDVGGTIHNTGDIYLTKNWTNNEPSGCLDPTTGTVILDGASTQTITGTSSTTFNNLDCRNGSKKVLDILTYVGGTTGVLMLKSSPFDLNTNTLTVTNPLPAAITRTTGYILSETADPPSGPGYGIVVWYIGNTGPGNTYTYPFGTISGSYIPFDFKIKTAGVQSGTGYMALATYPTAVSATPNNRPLPSGVSNLIDQSTNLEAAPLCADRYWITDASVYTTKPTADITFTYTDADWNTTGGSTNTIWEDSLRAWRWNGAQWLNPGVGTDVPSTNKVTATSINLFGPWTLKGVEPPPPPPCGEFFLPNAFSPNGDGKNEFFRPRNNCIASLDFRIYNRWGNPVYISTSPTDPGWDGSTPKGKDGNDGVYIYTLSATLSDGTHFDKKGTVTLVK